VAGGTLSTLRLLQRATPLRRIDPSSHHRRAYETRAGDVPLARCGCDREACYHTRERHTVLHLASQSRRVAGSDCGSCRSSLAGVSGMVVRTTARASMRQRRAPQFRRFRALPVAVQGGNEAAVGEGARGLLHSWVKRSCATPRGSEQFRRDWRQRTRPVGAGRVTTPWPAAEGRAARPSGNGPSQPAPPSAHARSGRGAAPSPTGSWGSRR
jgi:hypothetical protein